jgi:uncharacterized protein (DUF1499 family)
MAVTHSAVDLSDIDRAFPSGFAVWSRRLGLFSLQLILADVVLHRFFSLPTPVALNIFSVGIAGSALAVLLGLIALAVIWRNGRGGALSATAGIFAGLAMLAIPAVAASFAMKLPRINDITTDLLNPPQFQAIAKLRPKGTNPTVYPGQSYARLQAEAYSDIRPLAVQRSAIETFEILGDTVRRLRWSVISEVPPPAPGQPGFIEAVDRTLVFGFYDDVVIRIHGDNRDSRIDIRSASRYGTHDLGRNATRVRDFYKELQTRLEASVTTDDRRGRRARPNAAVPKRQKGGSAVSPDPRKSQGRAQPGAQRGPQSRERQR